MNLNRGILIFAFLHLIILLSIQDFILKFINLENSFLNIRQIIDFIQLYSTYLYMGLLSIFFLKIAIGKEDKSKNLLFYIGLPIYFIFVLFLKISWFLKEISDITIFHFKTGGILFLIFILIGLFFVHLIMKLSFIIRTDEEILFTGMNRIPNTIKIIRFGLTAFSLISFLFAFFFLYFLDFNLTGVEYPLYVAIINYLCICYKYINEYTLLKKYISKKDSDGIIKIRTKYITELHIPLDALNQHEYQYALLELTEINGKVSENIIFKSLNKCLTSKSFNFIKFEEILMNTQSLINEKNGSGWTPFLKHVADMGLMHSIGLSFNTKNNFQVLGLLLKYGADINSENYLGRDALNFSINYNYLGMVRFLLNKGAKIKDDPTNLNRHLDQALELRESEIYKLLKSKK